MLAVPESQKKKKNLISSSGEAHFGATASTGGGGSVTFVGDRMPADGEAQRRVMAPQEAHSAPHDRRDLSPAGAVVRKEGIVCTYNDRFKTDMHTGGIQDTGIGHLPWEPSCVRTIGVGWS